MKIAICSSSNDSIDNKYKETARKIAKFLAENNYDLIWGAASYSIMGICYEEFAKHNRKIYGFTTKKYMDDLKNLPHATHKICNNTFEMKKEIFNNADIILFLEGGTGTISELFTYIEEVRSNDVNKKLIIYNENKHFDIVISLINDLVKRNFNSDNIFNYFKIVNNLDGLKREFKEV